jgi:hypothetical protein
MDQLCTTAAHGRLRADPTRTVERHRAAMLRPRRLRSTPSVPARLAAQDSPYPAEPRLWPARVKSNGMRCCTGTLRRQTITLTGAIRSADRPLRALAKTYSAHCCTAIRKYSTIFL